MLRFVAFFMFSLALLMPAMLSAQTLREQGKEGEILDTPICSKLINRSDQAIMGTLLTAAQTLESGDSVRHRDNFKLAAGAEKDFCVAGPFYEGRRVEIILRTVIPLFTCRTKLDSPIYLDVMEDENGIRKLSATCS